MPARVLPRELRTRRHWQRLSPSLQREVALHARAFGIPAASERFEVSEPAVRRACAVTKILPKTIDKLATARALLKALGVKPRDLI